MIRLLKVPGTAESGAAVAVLATGFEHVPGQWLVYFVIAIWATMGIAEKAKSLFGKKATLPQPLETKRLQEMATREEVEAKIRQLWEQLASEREVARVSQGRLHNRIDQVAQATAEIKGELKMIRQNISRALNNKQ